MPWGFYGRTDELRMTVEIIGRNRWFFVKMTGRRRIGKTTLIQHAIQTAGGKPILYVQTPDSAPAGVLTAVDDALESFNVSPGRFARPRTLAEFARLIGSLVQAGYIVVLDEFQYFNRAHLLPFCSSLQAEVDTLSAQADRVPGGLIVLGSIHTEMTALLKDRNAPLFNRTTDEIELTHLDIASVLAILREHADTSPERLGDWQEINYLDHARGDTNPTRQRGDRQRQALASASVPCWRVGLVWPVFSVPVSMRSLETDRSLGDFRAAGRLTIPLDAI